MFDDHSPILALPYLQPAQAQKHVTHNEALRLLDVLVQPVVASRSLALPPANPALGLRYIIPASAGGAWAGMTGQIACAQDAEWLFIAPQEGWQAWVSDEARVLRYDGSQWLSPAETGQEFARLGIGATPDHINRLSLAAPATLFSHAGAGHQLKMNKATALDTVSLLFQSAWSGRAELGCAGNDDFALKVSADGSLWKTALSALRSTGEVQLPLGAQIGGAVSGTAVVQNMSDVTSGRLLKTGWLGLGGALLTPPANINITDNSMVSGGWYEISNTLVTTGLPTQIAAACNGQMLHLRRVTGGESRLLLVEWTTQAAYRGLWLQTRTAGAWGAWRQVFDSSSAYADMAQGGLMQQGSGVNGRWARFGSGLQICWHNLTASASADTSWSFPVEFVAAPSPVIQPSGTIALCPALGTLSATALSFNAFTTANARHGASCHLLATGLWK